MRQIIGILCVISCGLVGCASGNAGEKGNSEKTASDEFDETRLHLESADVQLVAGQIIESIRSSRVYELWQGLAVTENRATIATVPMIIRTDREVSNQVATIQALVDNRLVEDPNVDPSTLQLSDEETIEPDVRDVSQMIPSPYYERARATSVEYVLVSMVWSEQPTRTEVVYEFAVVLVEVETESVVFSTGFTREKSGVPPESE